MTALAASSFRLALPPAFGATALVALNVFTGPAASAAPLWASSRWAVTAAAEAGVGYDSNLFAREDRESDGYFLVRPIVSLQRLNSLTSLEASFSVRAYSFIDNHDLNSTDPTLQLKLRYPADDEQFATQDMSVKISRVTDANADIGGRVRHDDFGLQWEGLVRATGKLSVLPRFSAERTDYRPDSFNDNDNLAAGATIALTSNERLQLGAGYDFQYSRSASEEIDERKTTGQRHVFTLRGRGEFLPKVTGSAFIGVSHNDYTGAVDRREWDFVASTRLAWQATARGTLEARLQRLSYFAPDGSASTRSELGLEWNHELVRGFSVSLGSSAATIEYRGRSSTREADRFGLSSELRYALTERFRASLQASFLKNESDETSRDFDQTTVYLSVLYKL